MWRKLKRLLITPDFEFGAHIEIALGERVIAHPEAFAAVIECEKTLIEQIVRCGKPNVLWLITGIEHTTWSHTERVTFVKRLTEIANVAVFYDGSRSAHRALSNLQISPLNIVSLPRYTRANDRSP